MHTQQQAFRFIESCFGAAEASNGGLNATVVCPVCPSPNGKKKLAIRTTDFACHCWVCGYKNRSLFGLVYKFHRNRIQEFLANFPVEKIVGLEALDAEEDSKVTALPPSSVLLAPFVEPWLAKKHTPEWAARCIRYLINERHVTPEDFWLYKFCGCSNNDDLLYRNRVLFPSFDKDGEINFFTARSVFEKKLPKYFNPPFQRKTVVVNELNIDWSKPLLIVEGPFDLLGTTMNATCLLGSSLEVEHKLFQKIVEHNTPVLLGLDSDAKQKEAVIAQRLYQFSVPVKLLSLPPGVKDLGDWSATGKKNLKNFAASGKVESYSPALSLEERLKRLVVKPTTTPFSHSLSL